MHLCYSMGALRRTCGTMRPYSTRRLLWLNPTHLTTQRGIARVRPGARYSCVPVDANTTALAEQAWGRTVQHWIHLVVQSRKARCQGNQLGVLGRGCVPILFLRVLLLEELPCYHTPYHTIPYHTIPYHTIPYHTIPYHTIPYHTIPYHTIPYLTPRKRFLGKLKEWQPNEQIHGLGIIRKGLTGKQERSTPDDILEPQNPSLPKCQPVLISSKVVPKKAFQL